jgi:hypothetical protein
MNQGEQIMLHTIKRIALSAIVAISLATLAGGPASADTGFTGPQLPHRFTSWTFSPSTPSSVAPASGYVALNGASVTFTTPPAGSPAWTWYLSAELDIVFASGQLNQSAACVANWNLSPTVAGGTSASGYATPSYAIGPQSAHAVLTDVPLQQSTTYTLTPQMAATGAYTCTLTGTAAVHIVLLSNL